jgi:hypothetical protein
MGVEEVAIMAAITAITSICYQIAVKMAAPSGPPTARADVVTQARGHQINTKSNQAVIPLLYGEVRVGGIIVYESSSGADNNYYHMILVLGEGEIEGFTQVGGVDELYLDGKLYTEYGGTVYYELFKGTATQNVCATLQAACPEWNDPLRHTAYLYLRLLYDEDYYVQRPEATVGLKGLKVYSPLLDDIVYTDNPALMVLDLATRSTKRGGMGIH